MSDCDFERYMRRIRWWAFCYRVGLVTQRMLKLLGRALRVEGEHNVSPGMTQPVELDDFMTRWLENRRRRVDDPEYDAWLEREKEDFQRFLAAEEADQG